MLSGRVGHYEILERLGGGGIGEVYKARDTRLERWVAIKALRPDALTDPRARARFRREALAAAGLDHPYLCNVHELIEHAGRLLIVLEYVEGHTLADRLVDGPLPLPQVLRFGCELAEGLAAAHARGLVHRDVKPANVMITAHQHVKLMDFGLAKPAATERGDTTGTGDVTVPGEVVGTPRYMAPEQASGDAVDARADVFSTGVVLYECLTGRLPFDGDSRTDYLRHMLAGRVVPLATAAAPVPAAVSAAVMRCLARQPAERFPSGAELATELRRLRDVFASGTGGDSSGGVFDSARPPSRWGRMLVPALVAAFVVAIAVAVRRGPAPVEGPAPRPAELAAVVTWPSVERDARVSPDGAWVSFLSNRDGAWSLWLRKTSGTEPQPIRVPMGRVTSHVWSPSGDEIACAVVHEGRGWIHVVPAFFGGSPRVTVALPRASVGTRLVGWVGTSIYAEAPRPSSLWRLDLTSSSVTTLRAFGRTADELMRDFTVSPDGRRLAYASNRDGREDIWLADVEGGERRRLTDDVAADRHPVWMGESGDVVFQSNRGGQVDLWRQSTGGGPARQVTFSAVEEQPESASLDGSTLLVQQTEERLNLWRHDRATGASTQLTADALNDAWPSLAADGRRVAFQRAKPRLDSLYRFREAAVFVGAITDTGLQGLRQVGDGYGPRLSPDGRWVAFLRPAPDRPTITELWVADTEGGRTRRLTDAFLNPGFFAYPFDAGGVHASWSADVPALVYVVATTDGYSIRRWRPTAWETEPEVLVRSQTPLRDLVVSADGRRLAYLAEGTGGVRSVRVRALDSSGDEPIWTAGRGLPRLALLGWHDGGRRVIGLAAEDPDEQGTTVEVWTISRDRHEVLARVERAFPASLRLRPGVDVLYLTRADGQGHGLYELSLDSGRLQRLAGGTQPGATYSGLAPGPSGVVVYSKQDVKQDIWLIRFTP